MNPRDTTADSPAWTKCGRFVRKRDPPMSIEVHRAAALAMVLLVAGSASADRVHLKGGTVLDGEVEKKGGKVIVVGEAGTIAVPQDSVLRIEKAESAVSRFEAS